MDVFQSVGIGRDFLGYRIEELIGRGGMGVVYKAYDLRLKRMVALKLVAPALARDERFRERFARESELVMSLEHPNVVPIYDAGDVDSHVYLAMRLVDGTDLRSLLRNEGALEPERAAAICAQIAAALDAAHARGLVHRDVKPSNVLLDGSDHVYLADFGLTRSVDDEEGLVGEERFIGTPEYVAPEQLEGQPVDGRTDVYSLGCVLYECLTGETVFPRTSRLAVAWAHLEEVPPRPSERRSELPSAVDAVIGSALAKEPQQRFPTCGAFAVAADQALGLAKPGASLRRRSLVVGGAVGLVIAAAVAVGVTATVLSRTPQHGAAAPVFAAANTLARVDTATDKVSAVVDVGTDPVVAAGADYTVWSYNRGSGTITQVNGVTNQRVQTTHVSLPAECCSLFTGPVLAADASGAWFVEGGIAGRRPRLVNLPVGVARARGYPLPVTPTGVAVGGDAVWVVGHDSQKDAVLRIDPATGEVTKTARFRRSARIDSIAFGYGRVWVESSSTGTLYKIDPHAVRVERKLEVTPPPAVRPEILPRGGDIWVRVTGDGGLTDRISRTTLKVDAVVSDGPPDWQENLSGLGSLWWYDRPSGAVYREEVAGGPTHTIYITRSKPASGGPCLTSMAVASGSLWVTVAPSHRHGCTR